MKQRKFIIVLAIVLVLVLSVGVLAACNPDEWDGYSYRMGPSDIPTSWNYHTYQSNSSTYVLDYSSDTLYTFDYNDDKTGYEIVPSMAAGDPEDVTADYVGKYGVNEGDENKVYIIPLKQNLKFDNGDPITAGTFVESMQLLLNPDAANFRADNVYNSDLKIYNAQHYLKQNKYGYVEFVSANYGDDEYVYPENWSANEDGVLGATINGTEYIFGVNINDGGNWGSNSLADYAGAGYFANGAYATDKARNNGVILENADGQIGTMQIGDDGSMTFYDLDGNVIIIEEDADGNFVSAKKEDGTAVEGWEEIAPYVTVWQFDDELSQFKLFNEEGDYVAGRAVYANADGSFTLYDPETGAVLENPTAEQSAAVRLMNNSECYANLEAAADAEGYVQLTKSLMRNLQDCIAILHGAADVEQYEAAAGDYAYVEWEEMGKLGKLFDTLAWEEVGFFAVDDYHLGIALINPMEENFYLYYELMTSFFLVHPGKYKECMGTEQGVYTNDYGTSVDTYIGYGPYKLTQYLADSTIVLERNEHWHGYSEGEYVEGTYQTDRIVYTKVNDDATRLEMFLKGELDSYGLTEKDMTDYITSDYVYYNDSESTWYLAMNPDLATLNKNAESATPQTAGNKVIKSVLAITEFRQALSWSLDREQFNLTLSPTSGVAKALLSSMIIADPESGLTYRATDDAKDAILEYWGLADKWGEGKEYATREEAIDSITGYDPSGAKELFNEAYDIAVAEGYITAADIASGKWEVQLVIGNPVTADFYTNGFEFLKTNWTNAVVGTEFEGHVSFVFSQELGSTSFGNYLRDGSVDLLFGVGYGGSMFNPYSMISCFSDNLQYDPFTDKDSVMLDIELDLGDGLKTYRASLYEWCTECLNGTAIKATVLDANGQPTSTTVEINAGASAPGALRTRILGKVETKIMTLSNIFPMQTDATASLRCMRINYATEDYIMGVGRGGVKYYTYDMSDAEFLAYAKSQEGGVLNYK